MMESVDYQTGPAVCPKCGSSEQVRTARELLETMGGARDQAFQRLNQLRNVGQGQGQGQGGSGTAGDDDYDHYNVEGSDPGLRRGTSRSGFDSVGDNLADDIGGAVFGAALGFLGRRVKRALEDKVVPAVEAKMAQAQQRWEQSRAEQDAIAERYPELRSCLADQVIFVEGSYQTMPVSELKLPLTLAQADDVVARLR